VKSVIRTDFTPNRRPSLLELSRRLGFERLRERRQPELCAPRRGTRAAIVAIRRQLYFQR
jgi:hypothetical protein